ncbi:MAG: beta-galactosidase, partial [Candidatus Yanofskybacteria bacterium]|nr:beta-galactosidase [Candidatus Yanofskybacteria bacterium]
ALPWHGRGHRFKSGTVHYYVPFGFGKMRISIMNGIEPIEPAKKLPTKEFLIGIAIIVALVIAFAYIPVLKKAINNIFIGDTSVKTIPPTSSPTSKVADWGFFLIPQLGNPLDDLQHVKWSRLTGLWWSRIQNLDGTYDWTFLDERTKQAQEAGHNLIFELKTGNNQIISETECYNDVLETAKTEELFAAELRLHSCPLKPEYLPKWKTFVKDVIERYDGDGKNDMPGLSKNFVMDLQIENEPANSYYWHYGEDDGKVAAQSLLELLKLSVEARDEADPSTRIIGPGLVDPAYLKRCTANPNHAPACKQTFFKRNVAFTRELLKHPEYFDAIDVHFFNYFKFDPYFIRDGISWMREEMQRNGYQKPIYSLEWTGSIMMMVRAEGHSQEFADYFPYTAELGSVEAFGEMYKNLSVPENKKYRAWFEEEQAREFPKLFTTMLAEGAERMVYVRFSDYTGLPDSWNSLWWNWQGIVRYEGSVAEPILIKKPGYYTYQLLEQKLFGYDKITILDLGNDIFAYKFTFKEGNPIIVAWTEGSPTTIDLSRFGASGNVTVTRIVTELDRSNNPVRTPPTDVPASAVLITDTPVFVEGAF